MDEHQLLTECRNALNSAEARLNGGHQEGYLERMEYLQELLTVEFGSKTPSASETPADVNVPAESEEGSHSD